MKKNKSLKPLHFKEDLGQFEESPVELDMVMDTQGFNDEHEADRVLHRFLDEQDSINYMSEHNSPELDESDFERLKR